MHHKCRHWREGSACGRGRGARGMRPLACVRALASTPVRCECARTWWLHAPPAWRPPGQICAAAPAPVRGPQSRRGRQRPCRWCSRDGCALLLLGPCCWLRAAARAALAHAGYAAMRAGRARCRRARGLLLARVLCCGGGSASSARLQRLQCAGMQPPSQLGPQRGRTHHFPLNDGCRCRRAKFVCGGRGGD